MVGGFVEGGVLAHDAGQEAAGVRAVPCGHLVEDGEAVVHMAGQGEVAQDDALLQDAVCVEDRMAGLGHHGLNARFRRREIVRCSGKLRREGRGNIFQVGQPDIDVPPPALDAVQRFVAAGVADDGQVQPLGAGFVQRREDPRLPLAGGDKVDVVGPLRLKVEEDLGQMLHRDLFAQPLGADGVVLAEAALQGAAGEKHRAAAPCAADAGFLPEVEGGAGGL